MNTPLVEKSQGRLGSMLQVLSLVAASLLLLLLWGAGTNVWRWLGIAACASVALVAAKEGKKRRIPTIRNAAALMRFHTRSRIPLGLYLRAFQDDARSDHQPLEGRAHDADEEHISAALANHCIFVALGRPHEPFPSRGALRLYVEDSEWQPTISRLIRGASLIVFRWRSSESLGWELEQILAQGAVNKTVLLLPPIAEGEWKTLLPADYRAAVDFGPDSTPSSIEAGLYPVFAFSGSDYRGRLLHRLGDEELEDTSRRLANLLDLPELDFSQLCEIRRFYGPGERLAAWLARNWSAFFLVGLGLTWLILLDILTFEMVVNALPVEELLEVAGFTILACIILLPLFGIFLTRTSSRL